MPDHIPVVKLMEHQALSELQRLGEMLVKSNVAYYSDDEPIIDDATYDSLKARNLEIELTFPHLKSSDSPSDTIGARPSERFKKTKHTVRTVSYTHLTLPTKA